tara:strand:- start:211 stop:783 length:573 start_codon:yes stop_codon:yes gene_type:complete
LAIDLKPDYLPNSGGEPVGVKITSGNKPDGSFIIKMYYGRIKDDPDVRLSVPGSGNGDQFYLRFRTNYLDGITSQTTIGDIIKNSMGTELTTLGFQHVNMTTNTTTHGGRRVHVCGNEAASYFVQVFLKEEETTLDYTPNFDQLAKSIAGVDTGQSFTIGDGHIYSYTLLDQTTTGAVMKVTRGSPVPPS